MTRPATCLALMTLSSVALAQAPLTDDEVFSLLNKQTALHSEVPIHEGDTSFTIHAPAGTAGTQVSVFYNEQLIATQFVAPGSDFSPMLPAPAELDASIRIVDTATGALLVEKAVFEVLNMRGNVNYVPGTLYTRPDLADVVYLLNFLYNSGLAPTNMDAADVNADDVVNIADAVTLLNELFQSDPAAAPARYDMTADGAVASLRVANTLAPGGWIIRNPPRRGDPGVSDLDLDGNPRTFEWLYRCSLNCHYSTATASYYSVLISFGPRTPGTRPTGGNSAFVTLFFCKDIATGAITLVPMGKCVYPNGENSIVVQPGTPTTIYHLCQNRFPQRPPLINAGYRKAMLFCYNTSTGKLTIRQNCDENIPGNLLDPAAGHDIEQIFEEPIFCGPARDWTGWPPGTPQ